MHWIILSMELMGIRPTCRFINMIQKFWMSMNRCQFLVLKKKACTLSNSGFSSADLRAHAPHAHLHWPAWLFWLAVKEAGTQLICMVVHIPWSLWLCTPIGTRYATFNVRSLGWSWVFLAAVFSFPFAGLPLSLHRSNSLFHNLFTGYRI